MAPLSTRGACRRGGQNRGVVQQVAQRLLHQQGDPHCCLGLPQLSVQGHLAALGLDLAGTSGTRLPSRPATGLSVQPLP